jgi:hypothetical protein
LIQKMQIQSQLQLQQQLEDKHLFHFKTRFQKQQINKIVFNNLEFCQ